MSEPVKKTDCYIGTCPECNRIVYWAGDAKGQPYEEEHRGQVARDVRALIRDGILVTRALSVKINKGRFGHKKACLKEIA